MKPFSSHELPQWALWLIHQLASPHNREVIKGDFAEIYADISSERGITYAKAWYFYQIIRSLPSFFTHRFYFNSVMLINYLKVGARSLFKQSFFSMINIGGLAIGMAACLLILQYVIFERSYDSFHEAKDDLYRITLTHFQNDEATNSSVFGWSALAPALMDEVPEIDLASRYHPNYAPAAFAYTDENNQQVAFREDGVVFVDSTFLDMFSFTMLAGNPSTALDEPSSMVLSASMANKFFGNTNPIGKTLEVRAWTDGPFKVTGVLEDVPANSHFKFDFLLPIYNILHDEEGQYTNTSGWGWTNFATYLQLHPEAETARVKTKIDEIIYDRKRENFEARNTLATATLQQIEDIHLYTSVEEDLEGASTSYKVVYFFTLIAAIILIIAWLNYINLSTSRSFKRAKEVGVRKVVGARWKQLVAQFLTESAIINGLAILLAIGIAWLSLPLLRDLSGLEIGFSLWSDPRFWLACLALFGLGGLLTSIYPALILSSFKPITVLKGSQSRHHSGNRLRKGLVVIQFTASIALLSGTYVALKQVQFMRGVDLGMDTTQVLAIRSPSIFEEGTDFGALRDVFHEELTSLPGIEHIGTSTEVPGTGFSLDTKMRKETEARSDEQQVHVNWISDGFMDTYGLKLKAGRNFSSAFKTDEDALIVNESLIEQLGIISPEEALTHRVVLGGGNTSFPIIGVLEDFHWTSVKNEVVPISFLLTDGGNYYSALLRTSNYQESITAIKSVYDEVFPGNPFEYFFVNEKFDEQYKADVRFGVLFAIFAGLALFVACLGLVGLAAQEAAQRTKEIGVRKVLGANTWTVVRMFLYDFSRLVVVSMLLASPFLYLAIDRWLSSFSSRIGLTIWLFLVPGLLVLTIAMLSVSYHTIQVAMTNPIKSIRYE